MTGTTIKVDMEIDHYRTLDGIVEVWGYVGDYEVMVILTKGEFDALKAKVAK